MNTGRHVQHCTVEYDIVWFQMKRGLCRLSAPASVRTEVLPNVYDCALTGHGSVSMTVENVCRSFWLAGMQAAAEDHALTCPDCQQLIPRSTPQPGLLQSFHVPEQIWVDITMDFIVGVFGVKGCNSICVFVDRLSKYARFIACSSSVAARRVEQLLVDCVWTIHRFLEKYCYGKGS